MKLFLCYSRDKDNPKLLGLWHQQSFDEVPNQYTNLNGKTIGIVESVSCWGDMFLTTNYVWVPEAPPKLEDLPSGHTYRAEIVVFKDGEKIAMVGGDVVAQTFIDAIGELTGTINNNWTTVRQHAILADTD